MNDKTKLGIHGSDSLRTAPWLHRNLVGQKEKNAINEARTERDGDDAVAILREVETAHRR